MVSAIILVRKRFYVYRAGTNAVGAGVLRTSPHPLLLYSFSYILAYSPTSNVPSLSPTRPSHSYPPVTL